jgi:hypothetical protein
MGRATMRVPYWCAGEQRPSGIADLRSISMVSNDIQLQMMAVA